MRSTIEIRGARENNLKNVDVEIPREALTVVTGVSGSGKSSLAFDVIYGEGQRKLLDSLSAFSRHFIAQPRRADVDFVFGLSPVVAIMQQRGVSSPRSTVGTMTDIYDYLRLLFCVAGVGHCPYCDRPIPIKTAEQVIERILSLPQRTTVELRAPVYRIFDEPYRRLFDELREQGFRRFIIDGAPYDSGDTIPLEEGESYEIEVVIDRLSLRGDVHRALITSLETSKRFGRGLLRIEVVDSPLSPKKISSYYEELGTCEHHMLFHDLEPYYFAFNDPDSACRTCNGLGSVLKGDPLKIIAKPHKTLGKGAISNTLMNLENPDRFALLYSLAKYGGFDLDVPYEELPESAKDLLLYGTRGQAVEILEPPSSPKRVRHAGQKIAFPGFVGQVEAWAKRVRDRGESIHSDSYIGRRLMTEEPCPDCRGTRLLPQRLLVRVEGRTIHDLVSLPLDELRALLDQIDLPSELPEAGAVVLRDLATRLDLLLDIGLGYLSLGRATATLSGGENQRVRLSTQIGSGLMGMLYVLDEPSIGLHPRDSDRIIRMLKRLRDVGNTVLVVEHDPDTIRAADHIVEMGPGPGVHGGTVVVQGTLDDVAACEASLTGQFLGGTRVIPVPEMRRRANGKRVAVRGARENNLKSLDVDIPLGLLICVTGVSGSGKSSLINEVLYKSLRARLQDHTTRPGKVDSVEGVEQVQSVIHIDQSPIGRNSRSNPGTYTGILDRVRKLFAETDEAKDAGYGHSTFSYNSNRSGRCEECQGEGVIVTKLQFLPDIESVCPSCNGRRFKEEVLDIKLRGKTIADVLGMSFEEAETFFADDRVVSRKVRVLNQLGLGYLHLGQPSTTLSGGEAQRVKLAAELAKVKHGHRIYILDEPTTGLHLADIQRLLDCMNGLVEGGHTVIVIEHSLEVIKCADYIIDLGPEGGSSGGELVVAGTPEDVAAAGDSYTGQHLRAVLHLPHEETA
jgi:excinuclease ABC subunit A